MLLEEREPAAGQPPRGISPPVCAQNAELDTSLGTNKFPDEENALNQNLPSTSGINTQVIVRSSPASSSSLLRPRPLKPWPELAQPLPSHVAATDPNLPPHRHEASRPSDERSLRAPQSPQETGWEMPDAACVAGAGCEAFFGWDEREMNFHGNSACVSPSPEHP